VASHIICNIDLSDLLPALSVQQNMSFSTIKKFFINRKKKTVNIGDELKRSLIKNLEIFRHVPNETVSRIDDVKSTLTAILLLSVHDRSSLDFQLFDQKLKSLVEYFEQDVLVREYVNRVYTKQVFKLFKYYNNLNNK